jgi:hypothetical protein
LRRERWGEKTGDSEENRETSRHGASAADRGIGPMPR